jgi:hypothetical protein
MAEEARVPDQTRRLLKVFGVKLTDYEEKTAALLDGVSDMAPDERLRRVAEAVALTEDLNTHLGHITSHVANTQNRVLARVREALAPR